MRAHWFLALGLVLWGCADIPGFDGNPQMNPGQDCLVCHSETGAASNLNFSVGGTIYPTALAGTLGGLDGAEIDITDYNGNQFTLHSNGAGNFYSAEPIVFPATISVNVAGQIFAMQERPPSGRCNACHALETSADGTMQPVPLPAFGIDAGFMTRPPGHLYGFTESGCAAPPASCPSPAPSFKNQIQAIVEANCFHCHPAPTTGAQDPALDNYPDIAAASHMNISWLDDCGMPLLGDPNNPWFPMSPDEREILIEWINCGSQDN